MCIKFFDDKINSPMNSNRNIGGECFANKHAHKQTHTVYVICIWIDIILYDAIYFNFFTEIKTNEMLPCIRVDYSHAVDVGSWFCEAIK